MENIRVLQLGTENWADKLVIPAEVEWNYIKKVAEYEDAPYDVVFLSRPPLEAEMKYLQWNVKAYTLFVLKDMSENKQLAELMLRKKGQYIEARDLQNFIYEKLRYYYHWSYGEKYLFENLDINQSFKGRIKWFGNRYVSLEGEYGQEFSQIISWRTTLPIKGGQSIDFWLEYSKDDDVELELEITKFRGGSVSTVQNVWNFSESDLQDEVTITLPDGDDQGYFFASLKARGKGRLDIVALHDRHSRHGIGEFVPGGERYVTSDKEELFCYFDPGDRKPPLNVYFSGYRTQEGFEGYNMLRRLGCPFLLITDARLEGGCFYLGSQEYEQMVSGAIQKYVDELKFSSEDLIFSGISMGTFGAIRYGCDFAPRTIIMGKPLVNVGQIALNEKFLRPGGFPTAIDVLYKTMGSTDKQSAFILDQRFWNRFDAVNWENTKFVISYMIEDDYDPKAYQNLIEHLHSIGVKVYGKGIHGRHNDDTSGIVKWFVTQFNELLRDDFGRK